MKQRVLTYMRSTLGKSFSFDLDMEIKELLDEGWKVKQVASSTGIAEPNSGCGNSRKAVTITLLVEKPE